MSDCRDKRTIPLYFQPAFLAGFVEPDIANALHSEAHRSASPRTLTPKLKIWVQHPAEIDYCGDSSHMLTIALGNTPSTMASLDCVDVDDHVNNRNAPGFTTLGPQFPLAYATAAVYVSDKILRQLREHADGYSAPAPDHVAVVERMDDGTTRRYHGFVAIHLPVSPLDSAGELWLVYHPGSGTREAGRAPRKLLISNEHILPSGCLPSSLCVATDYSAGTNSVYLEREYIEQVALVEIPKKPSTAGRKDAKVGGLAPGAPCGPHLNVLGATSYGELDNIENALQRNFLRLCDGDTLFDALNWYSAKRDRTELEKFTSIDLIGHARAADHVLKLGEFTLTSRNVAAEVSRLLTEGVLARFPCVTSIRLLGCQTACSARASRVVATIRKYFPGLQVEASRTDLYAVHFDGSGLRPEAEVLLARHEVITGPGPGDPPPGSDRPLPVPDDDDDDDDDIGLLPSAVPPPSKFDFGTLSNMNAAATAAHAFVYWRAAAQNFANLLALLDTEPTKEKPLHRADYEVCLRIAPPAASIDDFRSFDLLLDDKPRIRVYTSDGAAYSFPFRKAAKDQVIADLYCSDIGIDLASARRLPVSPITRHCESLITQRKPSP